MPLASKSVRFGSFQLDTRAAEVQNNGTRIKLGEQPFQVLCALLEHPGEVVTREELRQRLWPADTFVDFDHSLNAAVKRLREALGDSADFPTFIETIPKHGYRFIAAVEGAIDESAEVTRKNGYLLRRFTPKKLGLGFVLLALVVGVTWFLLVSRRDTASSLSPGEPVPVAVYHGDAGQPALSPDGDRIAFIAGDSTGSGIYTALVGGEKSVQLTNNPGDAWPNWSPDGRQIAFYRFSGETQAIYTIPALGGTEHRVYLGPSSSWRDAGLDWSPDGETLAITEYDKDQIHSHIALLSLGDLSTRPLTFPDKGHADCLPAYSPKGSFIAFIRFNFGGTTSDLFLVPVTGGEPKRVSSDPVGKSKFGAAWTPDGREIVFSSGGWPGTGSSLWRVPFSGGKAMQVAGVGAGADCPSIARRAGRLVYQQTRVKQNVWRLDLKDEKRPRGPAVLLVSEAGNKMRPDFSPDGERIAFESDRLGYWEIWVCDVKTVDCSQLTSLRRIAGAPQWSPDGRNIAFEFHPHEQSEIYLLDVASGQARMLQTNPGWDNLAPTWSRDSKSLYFASTRGAGPSRFQVWKVPINGGSPVQVTRNGGLRALESVDHRFLYYTKDAKPAIWRMPIDGGEETPVLKVNHLFGAWRWTVGKNGLYFISFETRPETGTITFYDFSDRTLTPIWDPEKRASWGLTLSADGRSLAYVQDDFDESKIMLIENFH